jgi:RsiW-degrading membrane proteinase PrsW (M82 family)
MDTNDLIPTLALLTLILAVVFAGIGYALFKRKRANRHPMDQRSDGAIAEVRKRPD